MEPKHWNTRAISIHKCNCTFIYIHINKIKVLWVLSGHGESTNSSITCLSLSTSPSHSTSGYTLKVWMGTSYLLSKSHASVTLRITILYLLYCAYNGFLTTCPIIYRHPQLVLSKFADLECIGNFMPYCALKKKCVWLLRYSQDLCFKSTFFSKNRFMEKIVWWSCFLWCLLIFWSPVMRVGAMAEIRFSEFANS